MEHEFNNLKAKVSSEYDNFRSDTMQKTTEEIYLLAYQISVKEDIKRYINEMDYDLTPEQQEALMSSKNALDEIYDEWINSEEYNSFGDIGDCITATADKISFSQDRENARDNAEVDKKLQRALPFLNIKYSHHMNKINDFNRQKSECNDKINYRESKSVSEKIQNEPTVEKSETHTTEQDKNRKNYEKINPDFYKSLDKKDIYTKRLSDDVADNVMQKLDAQGVEYSAVRLAKDITGITVHKDFKETFDEAFKDSFKEVKAQKIQANKEAKSYNSEYYVSLPKDNRFIAEFATNIAQKYIDALKAENCEYSYRIKKTDRIAVTIDNRDSKALKVYNNFTNSIDVNQARGSVIDELSERGFSKEKLNFIQNLMEDPLLHSEVLFSFADKIKPSYDNHQIYTIYNKITDIYAQSDVDRLQDKNNLYDKLSEQIKQFDCEVMLRPLTENHDYSDSQQSELLNALKSDVPVDALSKLDESYSAEDIHNFVAVYKTYDLDKIDKFHQEHKSKSADTVKKTFTMSRNRMKDTAQKVSSEKREPMQKTTEHSI